MNNTDNWDICTAIIKICQDNEWDISQVGVTDEDYNSIEWLDGNPNNILVDQIKVKVAELKADYDSKQYQRDRLPEYPPATDYLDGVVKGDQGQIDKYIADCLAVKQRFPK
jgi:hypothetical protein